MVEPFAVTDCTVIAIATGEKAHNVRELRDCLSRMHDPGIMYFHFWDCLLRPRIVDPEYQNDFAAWAAHDLHDRHLAERLSIITPADYRRMDDLRKQVIEVIEDRMDELDHVPLIDVEHPFHFLRSQIVVFDSGIRIADPQEMGRKIPVMSLSSIFYHFIDSRRRTQSRRNDFTEWLRFCGERYQDLAEEITLIDPFFNTLMELRSEIAEVFFRHLAGGEQP